MKKLVPILCVLMLLVSFSSCATPAEQEVAVETVTAAEEVTLNSIAVINVYDKETDKYIRSLDSIGDKTQLSDNEFLSFSTIIECQGQGSIKLENISLCVNDIYVYELGGITISGGQKVEAHVSYDDMKNFSLDKIYSCVWSSGEKELCRGNLFLEESINWANTLEIPGEEEISAYNKTSTNRSPYVYGWYDIAPDTKYSEYTVEFKADYLPNGTYCCPYNFNLDMSSLEEEYDDITNEHISGYAGFQNISTGEKIAIMSFWNIYAKDKNGNDVTISAKRVYPETTEGSETFDNEGVGVHCSVNYNWEENHWYRAHLKCVTSPQTGNTVVQFWVCDLETGVYTLLVAYDVGYKNASFLGSSALFLENYDTGYAGNLRTMEIRNPKYFDINENNWVNIQGINMYINDTDGVGVSNYHGSCNFGYDKNRLWISTTGLGENYAQEGTYFSFKE